MLVMGGVGIRNPKILVFIQVYRDGAKTPLMICL